VKRIELSIPWITLGDGENRLVALARLPGCWPPNQKIQVLRIPSLPGHYSFHSSARKASSNALQNVVRETWRLAIRSERTVAHDSLAENRTEKNAVS
jgi:hypothetical protein